MTIVHYRAGTPGWAKHTLGQCGGVGMTTTQCFTVVGRALIADAKAAHVGGSATRSRLRSLRPSIAAIAKVGPSCRTNDRLLRWNRLRL